MESVPPRLKPTPTPTPYPDKYGDWLTWSDLKAEWPEQTNPYVHLWGTGPYPSLYDYSIQVMCDPSSSQVSFNFSEISKITGLYVSYPFDGTEIQTMVDGQDIGTETWDVQNDDEQEQKIYWSPRGLTERIVDRLASGASELTLIEHPGKDYENHHRFDVRGSKEVLRPVVEACR